MVPRRQTPGTGRYHPPAPNPTTPSPNAHRMRLNKYISETGLCSRREADRLIAERRVSINGRPAEIGQQVGASGEVRVDGRVVRARTRQGVKTRVYLALNKPVGITCTTERHVKDNIIDFVDHPERIFPVGRLDKDSEGLILLTSDGDIVNEILRAENQHEKEYLVSVDRPVTDEFLAGMAGGVRIHDTITLPCRIARTGRFGFRIILTQGLNRQIRLMCEVFGYTVQQLQRVRIGNVHLGRLRLGQWRNLTPAELSGLVPNRAQIGTMTQPAAPKARRGTRTR